MNIFVRGALFPHWTRKRSGGVVASVSVRVSWIGRVDPNGLARRGCCERVGLAALERMRGRDWVGAEGLSRACRLGCLGPSEPTRMGWSVHGLDSFILVRDGRSLPAFPLRFGPLPSVLCFAVSYASPVPPCTQVVASCSPRPASLSPRPRSFLPFGLHPLALRTTLFCVPARFLLLSSLHPRSSPGKRKPPKALPSGVSGYCRSRITSQEPSG